MIIGVPKEIKNHEYRVGMTPASVFELCSQGHRVLVEKDAGAGSGYADEDYTAAGAELVSDAFDVFERANLIVKVKEPQASERQWLKEGQTLFTYLHLAPDAPQTEDLLRSRATCIAYETVTDSQNRLPLLAPMSEVAGRMSVQAGARCLEKSQHGRGVLLGGVPGVAPANVVILGGGVVGTNALQMAVGLGARVQVLDKNVDALRRLDAHFGNRIQTLFSTKAALADVIRTADLVIGAVLVPGAAAPKLVSRAQLTEMQPGAVIVDVAIDQGGCFESSQPTTHDNPTYVIDDVVHYCVANMPGAFARTATQALNNATLPFIQQLANKGSVKALSDNPHLLAGLQITHGQLCCAEVGSAQDKATISTQEAIKAMQ